MKPAEIWKILNRKEPHQNFSVAEQITTTKMIVKHRNGLGDGTNRKSTPVMEGIILYETPSGSHIFRDQQPDSLRNAAPRRRNCYHVYSKSGKFTRFL